MLSVYVCVCVCCIIPVKEMNATESSSSQMLCEVPFHLPDDILVIWRFAEEVR